MGIQCSKLFIRIRKRPVACRAQPVKLRVDEIELSVVSESLAIPVWLYTICTPAISVLIIVRILQKVWEDFRTRNY